MDDLFFDDFEPGQRFFTQGTTLTEAAIIDYAFRYDPQPFHMDAEAAKGTVYGGLIASGFHTLSVASRLVLDERIFAACSMGSPGLDELRWPRPVRPGDTLRVEFEIREMRPSKSKPERGILGMFYETYNQRGEVVMTYLINHMLARRPEARKKD